MASRRLGLGLDTGGTYTDAAIVDMDTLEVLAKGKSQTTYHDLSIGILGAIDEALNSDAYERGDIQFVGLSTTLATNSILTGKGGKVGHIGIGWTPMSDFRSGADMDAYIKGGHGVYAQQLAPLDTKALEEAIDAMRTEVDSFVVSGHFSVYNPAHEVDASRMIKQRTGLPVVLGHHLTSQLGVPERSVTAVLNARLLPIISEFLDGVERSLKERGVDATILVFKGDGTLMNIEKARERPVETILSGPAASLMGGKLLCKKDNFIVVDIGGTSTDIAYLDDGFPRISKEGATVGHWRTRVRAIDIWTVGLGGDSHVVSDQRGNFKVGPERVVPLSVAASSYPEIIGRMNDTSETNYYLHVERGTTKLSAKEKAIYEFVRAHPISTLEEIRLGNSEIFTYRDVVKHLKDRGFLQMTGLTATDFMHVQGYFDRFDKEAARTGVQFMANWCHKSFDDYVRSFHEEFITLVGEEIMRKVVLDESGDMSEGPGFNYLLRSMVNGNPGSSITNSTGLDRPLVGIGAPTHIYMPPLEERMNVEVIMPKDHEVGNAVGAVCSQISETVTAQVFPNMDNLFFVLGPFGTPVTYGHVEQAVSAARRQAEEYVRNKVYEAGAENIRVRSDTYEKKFYGGDNVEGEQTAWVDIVARATGDPVAKVKK
ncbi:MAG TPA: hydantoinase/oxoprolinase family protein [Methanomassiliicoccales archaeon]|nr:hydantoinase/oxoprolinase family protein [Methanomassiliicoccales archaeon]HNX47430.1 hydantoinase/oxoprolinase family protein [Methanomassiliicoccales archaeon]HPR98441.1 hydantoinase/oxoprolinase family protein [Methanomassiliicoccales archaeon]